MLVISICLLGMALLSHGQGTDPAYAAKLKELYTGTVPAVQPSRLAAMMAQNAPPLILDTRNLEEYTVSHLPTAHFVDYSTFKEEAVANLDRSHAIVLYCTVGYRSERIGERLRERGFERVFHLYGGIFEWVNQGHEVVDSTGKVTQKVHAYSPEWGGWLTKGEPVYP